ncbi:MAG: RNA polymerase sigma factor [Flavobacteriaceae bacterium]
MDSVKIERAVELAKQNDQRAFVFLYDTFWNYIFGYLRKKGQDDLLAEELTLKTLARAFDRIHSYDSKYEFKTWLISISKNIQIDHLRSEKTKFYTQQVSIEKNHYSYLADENPTPEDQIIINQNLKELQGKIKELQPIYATVLRLRFFEELSYKEIAEKMEMPINTIKVTLLRAKKLLAQKIENNAL